MAEASGLWGQERSWMEGSLDSFVFSPVLFPFRGNLERSFNASSLVVFSLPKTSQTAPGADRGPLSERTWLPQ